MKKSYLIAVLSLMRLLGMGISARAQKVNLYLNSLPNRTK
jgi:hypothetical protein